MDELVGSRWTLIVSIEFWFWFFDGQEASGDYDVWEKNPQDQSSKLIIHLTCCLMKIAAGKLIYENRNTHKCISLYTRRLV